MAVKYCCAAKTKPPANTSPQQSNSARRDKARTSRSRRMLALRCFEGTLFIAGNSGVNFRFLVSHCCLLFAVCCLLLQLATSSQLGAAGPGIRFNFKLIRRNRTLRQQLDSASRSTVANTSSVLTLTLSRKPPQLALHDPVLKRVKTD